MKASVYIDSPYVDLYILYARAFHVYICVKNLLYKKCCGFQGVQYTLISATLRKAYTRLMRISSYIISSGFEI